MPWKRLAGTGLIGLGFVLFRPDWMNAIDAALSAMPVVVALAAWVLYYADENRPPVPFFETAAAFYGIAYGFNSFLIGFGFEPVLYPDQIFRFMDVQFRRPEDVLGRHALVLSASGSVLFMAGYYAFQQMIGVRIPHIKLPKAYDNRHLVALLWLLLLGHFAYYAIPDIRKFPSIGQFLQPVGYLAFGAFYMLWRKRRIGVRQAMFVALLLPVEFWLLLSGGLLTPAVFVALFAFFVLFREHGRFPWKVALAGALCFLIAYPTLGAYRSATWGQDLNVKNVLINPAQYVSAFSKSYEQKSLRDRATYITAAFVQRVGLSIYFSHVTRKSPGEVPYWKGVTYEPLFSSLIPRAIWSDKPEERLGGVVGSRYGFIDDSNNKGPANQSSVSLPWMVEMYANFGPPGVIVGMILNGLFFAVLVALFNQWQMTSLGAVVGLTVIFPLVYQQSNFTNMTGSLLPLTLSLLIYFWGGLRWAPAIWGTIRERIHSYQKPDRS